MINRYFTILVSYSNFFLGDYFEGDKEYTSCKECVHDILEDMKINKDLHHSIIDEPKAYYRLRQYEEYDNEILYSDYRIVKHRNGRISLKRSDVD